MTEKRYTYLDASRNKYIGSFFCNGKPLTNDEVADLLNQQENKIESLKKEARRQNRQKKNLIDYLNIKKHYSIGKIKKIMNKEWW